MDTAKRTKLIESILNRPQSQTNKISELVKTAKQNRQLDDWLWFSLLSAMSTMGNSRGYDGLILDLHNYELVKYTNLQKNKSPYDTINEALKLAKVRRYAQKSRWLKDNFYFIESCGGLNNVQNFVNSIKGKSNILQFMKVFRGIGEKYGRNIFMDLYHPEFINSIAIDDRIMDISDELEIDYGTMSYEMHEQIYVEVAFECRIDSWELDRLLYQFKPYYLERIRELN